LEEPVLLNDKYALQSIEGIVALIPLSLMDKSINFSTINLAKIHLGSGVSMGASHTSLVSLKETILLGSIFAILGTIFIFEGNRIKSSTAKDETHLLSLIDEDPSYGSSMLRKNILQKYQPIDRAKRQSLKDISKLLSAKSELISLTIAQSKITTKIKASDATIAKQVAQSAKAKKFKSSIMGKTVNVEKSL